MPRAITKYLFSVLSFGLVATTCQAYDYHNCRITGVGVVQGEAYIRFAIDCDPYVVLTTDLFTDVEEAKRLTSLIYTAYATQSPLFLVRSTDNAPSTTKHYAQLRVLNAGESVFD
jgi:hypothetical protein